MSPTWTDHWSPIGVIGSEIENRNNDNGNGLRTLRTIENELFFFFLQDVIGILLLLLS